ncbi:MAG: nitroreductase family protein [Christensenellales bacterium]
MHTALNILLTRRSIRQYKPLQITDDQLNAILTAGLFAPSAMNEQAWKLVAIQNPNELQKVAQAAMSMTGSADSPFYNAPTLIIVFVQRCHCALVRRRFVPGQYDEPGKGSRPGFLLGPLCDRSFSNRGRACIESAVVCP